MTISTKNSSPVRGKGRSRRSWYAMAHMPPGALRSHGGAASPVPHGTQEYSDLMVRGQKWAICVPVRRPTYVIVGNRGEGIFHLVSEMMRWISCCTSTQLKGICHYAKCMMSCIQAYSRYHMCSILEIGNVPEFIPHVFIGFYWGWVSQRPHLLNVLTSKGRELSEIMYRVKGGGFFLLRSTANSCTSREVSEAILSGHAPSCWSTLGHVDVSCWSPLSLWYLAVQNWWWLKSNRELEVPNCYIIMGNTNLNSGPSMWLPSLTPITFPPSRSEPSLSWECWEMSRYS